MSGRHRPRTHARARALSHARPRSLLAIATRRCGRLQQSRTLLLQLISKAGTPLALPLVHAWGCQLWEEQLAAVGSGDAGGGAGSAHGDGDADVPSLALSGVSPDALPSSAREAFQAVLLRDETDSAPRMALARVLVGDAAQDKTEEGRRALLRRAREVLLLAVVDGKAEGGEDTVGRCQGEHVGGAHAVRGGKEEVELYCDLVAGGWAKPHQIADLLPAPV